MLPVPLPADSFGGRSFVNVPGEVPRRFHTSGVAQNAGRIDGSTPVSKLAALSVQSRTNRSWAGSTSLKKT